MTSTSHQTYRAAAAQLSDARKVSLDTTQRREREIRTCLDLANAKVKIIDSFLRIRVDRVDIVLCPCSNRKLSDLVHILSESIGDVTVTVAWQSLLVSSRFDIGAYEFSLASPHSDAFPARPTQKIRSQPFWIMLLLLMPDIGQS